MAQRDCSAVHIEFGRIRVKRLQPSQWDRRECFIDFVQIDVVNL